MPFLTVPGLYKIAYEVAGQGAPIVLVHGFGSDRRINWRGPGWVETLVNAGRQVITYDQRGHGESDKPHDLAAYDEGELAGDIVRLIDHLGHARADVMGYSMGGFVTTRLLRDHPERVGRAIIGGVGENYYGRDTFQTQAIAAALREKDASKVTDPLLRQFRTFSEQSGNDLEALALAMTRPRRSIPAEEFRSLKTPVLIVLGEKDEITGPPGVFAKSFPNARVVMVPKRDHMLTVGDKLYKQAVLAFLTEGQN